MSFSPKFTHSFFIQNFYLHLFWTYSLCLYFCGKKEIGKKLHVNWRWNWLSNYNTTFIRNCSSYNTYTAAVQLLCSWDGSVNGIASLSLLSLSLLLLIRNSLMQSYLTWSQKKLLGIITTVSSIFEIHAEQLNSFEKR